jgi:hypothetical protein
MVTLIPVISSVNFGLEHFPEGMAVRVKAGTQLVLQSHYVNATTDALRTHDVAHLQTIPREDVRIFGGFYGLAAVELDLPNTPGDLQRVSFGCTIPSDANILLIGPHMHEWGASFKAEAGPPGALETIIDIEDWEPWMRDEPPALEYSLDDPFVLHAGDTLQTTCVFDNTSGHRLTFPSEMCATYGYYYPAPDGSEEWLCNGEDEGDPPVEDQD